MKRTTKKDCGEINSSSEFKPILIIRDCYYNKLDPLSRERGDNRKDIKMGGVCTKDEEVGKDISIKGGCPSLSEAKDTKAKGVFSAQVERFSCMTQHGEGEVEKEETLTKYQQDIVMSVQAVILEANHRNRQKICTEYLSEMELLHTSTYRQTIKASYCGTPMVLTRMARKNKTAQNLHSIIQEVHILMRLRHPHIVQFIGTNCTMETDIYYVTEYLEEGSLFDILHNPSHRLPWNKALYKISLGICRGMAYLHGLDTPIVHRNLKSTSVYVDASFNAKIGSFRFSHELKENKALDNEELPLWLAPEVIRGDRYTEKVDVYSFGIILAEVHKRQIPFEEFQARSRSVDIDRESLMGMIEEGVRPSLHHNCPSTIKQLYERCTLNEPYHRPSFENIIKIFETLVWSEISKTSTI